MTPRQLYLAAVVHNEQKANEADNIRGQLYLQASLIRTFIWAKKKPPTYEKLFGNKEKRQMDDGEIFRQVQALNKTFGGIDMRGDNGGGS